MSIPRKSAVAVLRQEPVAGSRALPGGSRRAPRSLDEALRFGPFHTALRFAIVSSGLSLEGVRRRLLMEGHPVSLSALSYWQRGLRRPERAESVRAVLAMERILGLRRSSLVALLGPPRPRGRWSDRTTALLRFEDALGPEPGLDTVLDGLDAGVNASVRHVSMQNDRRLGPGRSWSSDRVRRVVTALNDGADRFVALSIPDVTDEHPPTVRPVSGCRLGRIRSDPETGLHAAELLFDLPLRGGQTHVFEYESLAGGGGEGITTWIIGTRHPIRELILRAHFEPGALPVRCYHIRRERYDTPYCDLAELPLTAGGTVNLVSLDVSPGMEGLRWEWE
jgi:hypothetical protein